MKTLITIFTLVFTVMFSSTSFAEWTEVSKGGGGDTFYVDFERIRKHGGYTNYWMLTDFFKPNEYGDLSSRAHQQVDCEAFRVRSLSWSYHKKPLGRDGNKIHSPKTPEWVYPPPNSVLEEVLKAVCSR